MELQLTLPSGKGTENITVSDKLFAGKFNQTLVHQVVTACMAASRAGTKAQKTRAEVSGGGIKPWRQKGTGRARAGTIRSPIWRKGGVTFAAKPRDYTQKVNKKMYQAAMRSILSELVKQQRIIIVKELKIDLPKTKEIMKKLQNFSIQDALLVTEEVNQNLYLAVRNLPKIDICQAKDINPVDLIAFDKILFTVPAIKQLEEWLG